MAENDHLPLPLPVPFSPQSPQQLREVVERLRTASKTFAKTSTEELLQLLHVLGEQWRVDGPWFRRATQVLAGGLSAPAVHAALTNLAYSLNKEVVGGELDREFGRRDLLETWRIDEFGSGCVRGFPLGVVAQVLAGNVFLGGVIGLAQCLLSRNAALLKLSRRDAGLTRLFVESIREIDPQGVAASATAVCQWDSNRDEFNQVLREDADAVVVWGGQEAVAAYPTERCRGRVVQYGPRLGIGFMLVGVDLEAALPQLAWDVALWEQQACSSPRLVFVEDAASTGTKDRLSRRVAEGLSLALLQIGDRLPARSLSLDEKSEVLSLRENAYWKGGNEVYCAAKKMDHSVILCDDLPTEIPVGYRTVFITPLSSVDRIPAVLAPYREALQTAVLAAPPNRWPQMTEILARSGVTQIAAAGSAAARFLGLPHEGEFGLRRLNKLVSVDLGGGPLTYPGGSAASADSARSSVAAELTGEGGGASGHSDGSARNAAISTSG